MTVYDFCQLLCEDSVTVNVYDLGEEQEVFQGDARHTRYCEFCECDVESIEVDTGSILDGYAPRVTLNIYV